MKQMPMDQMSSSHEMLLLFFREWFSLNSVFVSNVRFETVSDVASKEFKTKYHLIKIYEAISFISICIAWKC